LKVLVGTIANQRLPNSIVEDSINKKWRPIPAGLLSEEGAMHWLLVAIPITIVASIFFGGTLETLVLIILVWMVSFILLFFSIVKRYPYFKLNGQC
jgi:4-hydroxybenzoate polyprenyltransferase